MEFAVYERLKLGAVLVMCSVSGSTTYGNCVETGDPVAYPFAALMMIYPVESTIGVPWSCPVDEIVRPSGSGDVMEGVKYVTGVVLSVDTKN